MTIPTPESEDRRRRLLEALEELHRVSERLHQAEFSRHVAKAREALEHETLRVAVLGLFKRGKTTLVNALLGREVLPTGILPLTSIPTEVLPGSEQCTVVFLDGQRADIPISEIPGYVTEAQNPKNRKKVARVQVHVPAPLWAPSVVLLDTPGIGSTYTESTETTYRVLPEVDAALFLLSADLPITEAEQRFLKDVAQYAAKFFFVFNKSDLLGPGELEEALSFTRQALTNGCGFQEVRLYPLSSRDALRAIRSNDSELLRRSNLSAFLKEFTDFLRREKGETVVAAATARALRFATELRSILEFQRQGLRMSEEEFLQRADAFRRGVERLREERRSVEAVLDRDVAETMAWVDRELQRFKETQAPRLLPTMQKFTLNASGRRGRALVEEVNQMLRREVLAILGPLQTELEAEAARKFGERIRRYGERMEEVVSGLASLLKEHFGIALEPVSVKEPFSLESRLYPHVEGLYEETLMGQTMLFLPASVLRRRILQLLKHHVALELDKQAGRIRADLLERLQTSSRKYKGKLAERVEDLLTSFQQALYATQEHRVKSAEERKNREREIEVTVHRLGRLVHELSQGRPARLSSCAAPPPEGLP